MNQFGQAAFPDITAAETSNSFASLTRQIFSPVSGLSISRVSPEADVCQSPPIYN